MWWEFTLPTEVQWEYSSGQVRKTAYSWGDELSSDWANYNWDGDWDTGNDYRLRMVGNYSPNRCGFFDIQGNVWEWTANSFGTYSSGAQTDPIGEASGPNRVQRKGWYPNGTVLRSARHTYSPPEPPQLPHRLPCLFQTAVS